MRVFKLVIQYISQILPSNTLTSDFRIGSNRINVLTDRKVIIKAFNNYWEH